MKDTLITAKRKKTELVTFIVCFILANVINVFAIISYGTSFTELYSVIGYVFVLSVALYIIWTIIRFLFYGIRKTYKQINRKAR